MFSRECHIVKKMLVAAIAVAPSYPLAGRYSPTESAIGGLGGAGIGAALSNGSTTGAATAPPPPTCAEWGWNDYGRRACIADY